MVLQNLKYACEEWKSLPAAATLPVGIINQDAKLPKAPLPEKVKKAELDELVH